jgi:WD40 repeat protein
VVRSSPPEEGRYSSLALSPDGSLLALGGESGEVKLVSTATFRVVGVVPPAEPTGPRRAFALAFSPVEDLLAVGDASGELHLWGLGDRQAPSPRRLLRLSGSRYRMLGLGFSPDGRMLASIDVRPSEHRVVEFWELASLQDELSSLGLGW